MKKIPRLFLKAECFTESQVELPKKQEHYLKNVLRRRSGSEFVALDGAGRAWVCALNSGSSATKVNDFTACTDHPLALTVGIALCKGARYEGAIEKLAELGVRELVPLETERTERKSPSQAKLERWNDIALSASALAYRLIPMQVRAPMTLAAFLSQSQKPICFCHPGGQPSADYFAQATKRLTILIGPEGGFSTDESRVLESAADKVDLGPYNLRVETAATVASGLALNLHSELRDHP